MQPIIITTTCAKGKDAEMIANELLQQRLIACAQIDGPITSAYWWQGSVTSEPEYRVTMKSIKALFPKVVECIQAIHPYDVPEIIASEIVAVNDAYRTWLCDEVRGA